MTGRGREGAETARGASPGPDATRGNRTPAVPDVEARYRLERPGFELDVDLRFPGRGVTGLFGPSGSGKTTLLRCLAGIERPPVARLRVAGETWEDSGASVRRPAHRRRVGYVFQEPSLFPHLDARANIAYGHSRTTASERRIGIEEAVEWLGVGPLLDRKPEGLSGGERQRVAIARALVTSPRLLLMDEPLAALDRPSREAILPYLERLPAHLDVPIVYVSHSLREVARLADHLVWLADGRVEAAGPAGPLVARIGAEREAGQEAAVVVEAAVRGHDDDWGLSELQGPWGPVWVRRRPVPPGAPVRVQILARDVSLGLAPEEATSILNQFPMAVAAVEAGGEPEALVRLRPRERKGPVLLARVMRKSADRLGLAPGTEVWARVKAVAVVE